MKSYAYLGLVYILWAQISYASAEPTDCKAANYTELVTCATQSAFEIRAANQQIKSANQLEAVANQMINPELDVESVSKGSEKSETAATLFFTLRLGGKSEALTAEAKSEVEKSTIERDLVSDQTRLDFMLKLYRLSHLKSELGIEAESVETFTKIIRQFQKRTSLSPEQDVSLSVFKMALADHELRYAKLKSDEQSIFQELTTSTGLEKSVIAKNLPLPRTQWPTLETNLALDQAPQIKKALAELKYSESQKKKADSEAWPDIKIGPAFKTVKDDNETNSFIGFGLSLPLPIFNQGSSSKAYSTQKIVQAKMSYEQIKRQTHSQRNDLISRYEQTVSALKNTLSQKAIQQNHLQLEKQFFKGLISSSLVIEAHRQLFELEERRNLSQLEALETLGKVLIIDAQFNGVTL